MVAVVAGYACRHSADAGLVGVAELLGGEVDALHKRAGVQPFQALMPALYAGRVVERLPHPVYLAIAQYHLAARHIELAAHTQDAHCELGGAFHLFVANVRRLEEVGVE